MDFLMNKKAKIEELMEISRTLCEMEDDMVNLQSTIFDIWSLWSYAYGHLQGVSGYTYLNYSEFRIKSIDSSTTILLQVSTTTARFRTIARNHQLTKNVNNFRTLHQHYIR